MKEKPEQRNDEQPIEDRVTKVLLHGDGDIEIHLQMQAVSGGVDTTALRSPDQPNPELQSAMQGLAAHVVKLLEMPSTYVQDMTVTTLSITYEEGIPFVTFAVEKLVLGLKVFKFKTPQFSPSGEVQKAVDRVCDAAMAYLQGDRLQMDLFDGNEGGYKLMLHRAGRDPVEVTNAVPFRGAGRRAAAGGRR